MATPSVPMIRPSQIDSLPHLNADQKQTYKNGLMNLWNAFDNNAEGSQAKNEAKLKIQNASRKIMQQLGGGQRQASNAAPQQQQAQQGQRPQQAGQPGVQGGQTQGVQQGPAQGQQNPQQMQQQQQQQQRPQPQQQPSQMAQPPQAQQQGADGVQQLQNKVKQMVQNLVVFPEPTTANSQQFEQYKLSFQQGLGTSILKRERARGEIQRLEQVETQMKGNGQALSDDLVGRLNGARQAFNEASSAVTNLERKNEQNKNLYNQKQARNKEMQQAQAAGQQANGQQLGNQQVNGAQAQTMQRTASQQAQANAGQGDVKMEQQQQQSPAPPQFQQQQQQGQTPQAGTPVQQQQQQQMPPQQPQQQQQQPRPQAQGTPQNATQPQQQFQQNNMPQQQQQRPPMQQQQSQQHSQYAVPQQQQHQTPQQQQPQQYQQTPQSAMQQNNTPNQQQAPQQPQALTQRDAMARSAQSYTQQQQHGPNVNQPQQPMQQQHGNMPNGLPFNQPQSAQQHTPTSGFPPTQQMNSAQTKFPIPKDLRMDPRTQAPVQGPPSRPTMMGQGGMMNVPGVQKPAPFTLEGEGDHVLSKRKLDELVRQITGSVSPEDGLSPEVEEAVLSLTDNFVDNVIQKACSLAKLRQGQTLEVKDIQMVLERNYGIRIPGYSLDELRTVRKFQPAPGWVGKVQAVQAGKVMGGNKDA